MKRFLLIISSISIVATASISDQEIANMFILGFYGNSAKKGTKIYNDICYKGLGGVIIFKNSPVGKGKIKNFSSKEDLKRLTKELKSCGKKPLIAVDQEGGLVQRIKFKNIYPKASTVAKHGLSYAKNLYENMGLELHSLGVNLNFAPVADLAVNPNNQVIVRYGRSYGSSIDSVVAYDKVFINAMHKYKVATSLKHFPGHGSSLGDTHKGFVDVTNQWQERELQPYYALSNLTDTVMVSHIYNKKLDSHYPASLSRAAINGKLRGEIGFRGVVITDDLQMGAIKSHYSLNQTIRLAINAGNDILLFANQLSAKNNISIEKLIKTVRELINSRYIKEEDIKSANKRINSLKNKLYTTR